MNEAAYQPTAGDIRMVIAASSAGTIFEWYDFFIYGTLAAIIGKAFFPSDNATLEILLVWAGFAVGFGFRPLGAVLFGFLGDRLGRKYTFLITVTLMRSEEHTSELQSLMRISYAVFCLTKTNHAILPLINHNTYRQKHNINRST